MQTVGSRQWMAVVALAAYLAGALLVLLSALTDARIGSITDAAIQVLSPVPAVVLGVLLTRRRPRSAVGPALMLLGAAPALTNGIENWGATFTTAHPWPGALAAATVEPGVWVFNLAGFVLLCLTFPDGLLPGRRWRMAPLAALIVAIGVNAVVSLNPAQYVDGGGSLPGHTPVDVPRPVGLAANLLAGGALLAVLAMAVGALVVRYRAGGDLVRLQLRWLVLGAGSVPVLLAAGWGAQALGASTPVAYAGFLFAMLILVPAAVTMAILFHDLFDVDRLLGESVSWLATTAVAAAVFAVTVLGISEVGARASRVGVTAAAFVTALLLLPVHRLIQTTVGRLFDRERTVMLAVVQDFVHRVRDGRDEPEEVEHVLRTALDDETLRVLLRVPGTDGYVDLAGRPVEAAADERSIPLSSQESAVGLLVLGRLSARRLRRARALVVEARLPIEVSRLRLELRRALDDAKESRARLVEASAVERRRLERDLHDGAQQRIVAVGMRLRSAQRRHQPGHATHQDLELAVAELEDTVAELRRLAHGVRPSRLDDGLYAAIRGLLAASPIPVEVEVSDVEVSEVAAVTAYFVVAESLANTYKHAQATRARVAVSAAAGITSVEVSDDGIGGARPGFGLTALEDRVAALGGHVEIVSRPGAGTTVRAAF